MPSKQVEDGIIWWNVSCVAAGFCARHAEGRYVSTGSLVRRSRLQPSAEVGPSCRQIIMISSNDGSMSKVPQKWRSGPSSFPIGRPNTMRKFHHCGCNFRWIVLQFGEIVRGTATSYWIFWQIFPIFLNIFSEFLCQRILAAFIDI